MRDTRMTNPGVNKWTRETLHLAQSGNYLDRVLEVYPAQLPPARPLPPDIRSQIEELYAEGRYEDLVLLLVDLRRLGYPFPVEHPYAALLRHLGRKKRCEVVERNRRVIAELAGLLKSIGLEGIIRGVERPKDINRTLGAAFKNWIRRGFNEEPFHVVEDYMELAKCPRGRVCIYAGPDERIAEYIRNVLGLRGPSGRFFDRDFIARVRDVHVIGEARFLSTPGGSQNRDLENTLRFVVEMEKIGRRTPGVLGIALIDGIVWYHDPYIRRIEQVATGDRVVMSAVFLRDYLLSLLDGAP